MASQLMVHGICKNLFTYDGSNGIAKVTVATTVCSIEKRKEKHLAMVLSSIMVNGPSTVYTEFRFEPVSVAFSALNLAIHFHGWLSFFILLNYKLPLKQDKKVYYEYATLWHIYGLLSMNSWFWSSVFHSRDVDLTERLDYSSAVALLGYSLILAILRTLNIRIEAKRVMVSAPLIAFVITHISFLNFYKMDYGWNMKVCVVMGVAQLLIWAIWAGVSRHPSRWKLWMVVVGGGLAMLLEIYDFPPYKGFIDAHALWHATTIPLTYIWWSFIRDDAEFRTSSLLKRPSSSSWRN
ncbi:post-GPI attachment to proteins factor 3 isoform X3 [Ricinus communis]|uniref:post-GPI attachment to proteins factor 3 isoform X3 n=1 Tax=Ricinus communis TaxID=3988 RepID=UPI00201B0E66|nr:post-GPI attachment to proteins factor 3 isoform X3 [Ricinus communis]